nr:MAG TPA: cysteine-rich protein [Caudoviricetes sp.]
MQKVYCPVCAAAGMSGGKGKLLLMVDENASGTIYPYCRRCKINVKIDLPLITNNNKAKKD